MVGTSSSSSPPLPVASDDTIALVRKHLITVRNAYLKPLLQINSEGKPLHYNTIDQSYESAKLVLSGLQSVDAKIVKVIREDLHDLHSKVVSQYISAAKDDVRDFVTSSNLEPKDGESNEQFLQNGLNAVQNRNWKFQWDSCSSVASCSLEEFVTPLLQQKFSSMKSEEEGVVVVEEHTDAVDEVASMEEGEEEETEDGEADEEEETEEENEEGEEEEDGAVNEEDCEDDEEGEARVDCDDVEAEEKVVEVEQKPPTVVPPKKKPLVKRVFGAAKAKLLAEKKAAVQKKSTAGAKPQQRGASQQRASSGGRGRKGRGGGRSGGGRGGGKNSNSS